MFVKFDPRKAVQAVGVIFRANEKDHLTRWRILKLLYLAERQALLELGRPIVGGTIVAMKYGTLHSEVLDLINGRHAAEQEWSTFFSTSGPREVVKTREPSVMKLSRREVDILIDVTTRHAHLQDEEIVDVIHELPEYGKFYISGTSTRIPTDELVKILCEPGRAAEVIEDLRERALIDEFFEDATSP